MIQSVLMEAAGVQGRRTARNVSRGAEFRRPSSPLTLAFVFPLKTPKALLTLRPCRKSEQVGHRVPAILSEQYVWQVFPGMGACLCYLSHGISYVLALS